MFDSWRACLAPLSPLIPADIYPSSHVTHATWCRLLQLFLYREVGSTSNSANVALLLVSGFMVNGPYALITTAVSAELVSA